MDDNSPRGAPCSLTPREWEVARLVAQGKQNLEIASALCITLYTVESHLKHIYAKVGVHSRFQLARWYDRIQRIKTKHRHYH